MTTEHVIQDGVPRPRFAVGMRGYDRAQVEAYITEHARWADQAGGRIRALEARVSELEGTHAPQRVREQTDRTVGDACRMVDRFVEEVDARAAELDTAIVAGVQPHLEELRRHVDDLEDERRSAQAELHRLRESLETLVVTCGAGDERGPRTSDGHQAPTAGGRSAPGPRTGQ
jgi:cell division septum initiation protein DivIVA